jgi:hypothetical protein
MDPGSYYYGEFRSHFEVFWRSLEKNGSCSRARAHQREEFWGHRMRSLIANLSRPEGQHFSVGDLVATPEKGLPDHLADIPEEDQCDFLYALFYTVLVDQVMYTHRRVDYAAFRLVTQYPKMDRTVGWAYTMMMANPYEVFDREILDSRKLPEATLIEKFELWARFVVVDLQRFFSEYAIGTTTWSAVREAMLSDQECVWGRYGSIFRQTLLKDRTDPQLDS